MEEWSSGRRNLLASKLLIANEKHCVNIEILLITVFVLYVRNRWCILIIVFVQFAETLSYCIVDTTIIRHRKIPSILLTVSTVSKNGNQECRWQKFVFDAA